MKDLVAKLLFLARGDKDTQKVDKSRTKGIDGTGLGLAIASWIIQRHGGRIDIESQVNIGTKVMINLPRYHYGPVKGYIGEVKIYD